MRHKSIISKFAHKISILKNESQDEIEEPQWQTLFVCFSEVKPVCESKFTSIEGVSFGDVITAEYFYFKLRYIEGITKEMRILFHNRNFEIKRIINDEEKNRMLSIIAQEI